MFTAGGTLVLTQEKKKDLRCFKVIPEILGSGEKVLRCPPERQMLTIVLQNCEESTVNYATEKYLLHDFIHFSTIFCQRLYMLSKTTECLSI